MLMWTPTSHCSKVRWIHPSLYRLTDLWRAGWMRSHKGDCKENVGKVGLNQIYFIYNDTLTTEQLGRATILVQVRPGSYINDITNISLINNKANIKGTWNTHAHWHTHTHTHTHTKTHKTNTHTHTHTHTHTDTHKHNTHTLTPPPPTHPPTPTQII